MEDDPIRDGVRALRTLAAPRGWDPDSLPEVRAALEGLKAALETSLDTAYTKLLHARLSSLLVRIDGWSDPQRVPSAIEAAAQSCLFTDEPEDPTPEVERVLGALCDAASLVYASVVDEASGFVCSVERGELDTTPIVQAMQTELGPLETHGHVTFFLERLALNVHVERVRGRFVLLAAFDNRTAVGLVRAHAKKAIAELLTILPNRDD